MTERYLRELRRRLRGAPDAEDIVREIRSHILAAGPDVAATIARLGSPAELAASYGAGTTTAPMPRLIRGFAYLLAIGFLLSALMKPIAPHRAGLWLISNDEFSLRLGLGGAPPPQAVDVLGWWIIPIGLALAAIMVMAAPRLVRQASDERDGTAG